MKYIVVTEDSSTDLSSAVCDLIAHGWSPLGGVSHSSIVVEHEGFTDYPETWAQAMTKDGE